jgi:hypothetical protein
MDNVTNLKIMMTRMPVIIAESRRMPSGFTGISNSSCSKFKSKSSERSAALLSKTH